ncbi:hypothetical protein [Mucilaginibacter boryungensis]|uniref:Bulb-type lectin domain-containing protein n=1 Tax=Mucilaginibacter boryungensis TaxID=768480 RepID=A0ABR9XMQ4_9SPHI|nr:hypothetical protein [Mucilaginibacter boryungensis]MBE9668663.1 hypothetical protein [Mucilaginibacter boryungensis]
MLSTRNITFCLTLVIVLLSACKKGAAPKPSFDIFALGSVSMANISTPAYWKNGQFMSLQAPISANALTNTIALHGTAIYTAGSLTGTNGMARAAYWKNGGLKDVSAGFAASTIKRIAFRGDDTYMFGFAGTSTSTYPVIWKNDVAITLPPIAGIRDYLDLAFSGSDTYLLTNALTTTNTQVAGYVKNGALVKVRDTTSSSDATAMTISGSDVYLCGNGVINSTVTAVYWKNGVRVQLASQGQAVANAITVSGNDVYVAGNNNGATIWKNGQVIFHDSGALSAALSIAVNGTDVYAGGYSHSGIATIWKNGQAMQLPTSMPGESSRINKLVLVMP